MFGIYSSLMFLGESFVCLLLLPVIALPVVSVVYFVWDAVRKFRSRRGLL